MRIARRFFVIIGALVVSQATAAEGDRAVARLGDDLFSAGGELRISQPVRGDALIAGGNVTSTAEIGGDLAAAGGEVELEGRVGGDLYAAGGRLSISSGVTGNARIAGGEVRIARDARIDGGATVTGGRLRLDGTFGKYVSAAGGEVTLGGRFLGDVVVRSGQLQIEPGAEVAGRLDYYTPESIQIPAGAVLRGEVRHHPVPARDRNARWGRDGLRVLGWLWLAGLFVLGWILAAAFPRFAERTSATLGKRPWATLAVGFVLLICVPVLAILLAITVIGLPLALLLVLLYLAALVAAYVVGAWHLAERALRAMRTGDASTSRRLLAFALVLLALAILGYVPVLGGLLGFLVLLAGLGAIAFAVLETRRVPSVAPAAPA